METNRQMSAGQKSRHIIIRYFWIKDQTKALEIDADIVQLCQCWLISLPNQWMVVCLGSSEMSFLDTNLLALFEKFCTQMSRSMLEIIMCDS